MATTFEVQLTLKDKDAVIRGLESLGPAGERAAKKIEQASKPASAGLAAIDKAAQGAQSQMQSLASHAGIAGEAMQALGRGGLVAAAGIGAAVAALGAALIRAREAIDHFSQLNDSAERIGLGVESFQGLTFALGEIGVKAEQSEKAFTKLNDAIGKVQMEGADAPKAVQEAFAALGVSMDDVQKHGDDLNVFLPMLADGFRELGSTAERTTVAKELFGREGAKLLPLLAQGADALATETDAAREMGAVLGEEVVQHLDEVGDKLGNLDQVLSVQMARAFGIFGDSLVAAKQGTADLLTSINDLLDVVRQKIGPNVFSELAEWALSPIKPIQEVIGLLQQLSEAWGKARQSGASGSWGGDDPRTGSFGLEVRTEAARGSGAPLDASGFPSLTMSPTADPRRTGGGTAGWPGLEMKASKEKKTRARSGARSGASAAPREERFEFDTKPFEEDLQRIAHLSEETFSDTQRRHEDTMAKIVEANMSAHGQIIELIERRRDAEIKALDEIGLSEEEKARAKVLIADTANQEIAKAQEDAAGRLQDQNEAVSESFLDIGDASKVIGPIAVSAFEDAIISGAKFSDILEGLAVDIERVVIRLTIMKAVEAGINAIGGLFAPGPTQMGEFQTTPLQSRQGNVFSRGNVVPFARGGVFGQVIPFQRRSIPSAQVLPFARGGLIDRPTMFPMARGAGLAGEAGPEAIVPLRRTASGDLGVSAGGVAPKVNVVVNNYSSAKVETEQRQTDDGGIEVLFNMMESRLSKQVSRPGTTLNRAVTSAQSPVRQR